MTKTVNSDASYLEDLPYSSMEDKDKFGQIISPE